MSSIVGLLNHQKVIKKAEELYKRAGISKDIPVDIESAAKNLGVQIIRKPLTGNVSGFLFLDKSGAFLGVNSKHNLSRQKFTIAHELGHFFLHAPKGEEASFIDKDFFVIHRDSRSHQGSGIKEIEANIFAAEVLMPADILYKEVASSSTTESVTELRKLLAHKFKVSEEAMRFRLNNLGLVRF